MCTSRVFLTKTSLIHKCDYIFQLNKYKKLKESFDNGTYGTPLKLTKYRYTVLKVHQRGGKSSYSNNKYSKELVKKDIAYWKY